VLPEGMNHPALGSFGRLDKDTTGLFLMGTDGGLQQASASHCIPPCKKIRTAYYRAYLNPTGMGAQMLLHPSTHFRKSYLADLRGCLSDEAPQMFAEGTGPTPSVPAVHLWIAVTIQGSTGDSKRGGILSGMFAEGLTLADGHHCQPASLEVLSCSTHGESRGRSGNKLSPCRRTVYHTAVYHSMDTMYLL
jgi:hypothetical protein